MARPTLTNNPHGVGAGLEREQDMLLKGILCTYSLPSQYQTRPVNGVIAWPDRVGLLVVQTTPRHYKMPFMNQQSISQDPPLQDPNSWERVNRV